MKRYQEYEGMAKSKVLAMAPHAEEWTDDWGINHLHINEIEGETICLELYKDKVLFVNRHQGDNCPYVVHHNYPPEHPKARLVVCPCGQLEIWSIEEVTDHGICRSFPHLEDGKCPVCQQEWSSD